MEYKWTVLTVTTVGVLMAGIDSRVLIVGLPNIAENLKADPEQAIWLTQAYVLASTAFLLIIGRISDIMGRVKIYNIGFIIFTVGSLLTGLANSPIHAILARGLQGIGGSMMFANSIAIIVDAWPQHELGLGLGVNQIAFRAGAMIGLVISGIIISLLNWRFLFYINVPIGIFGTLWAHFRLKEVGKIERGAPIDWIGFVSFTLCISSFLLAITFITYGISNLVITMIFSIVSIISLIIFIFNETRTDSPILDLRLLKIKTFLGGTVSLLFNVISWGAVFILFSLYLQLVRGYSPIVTGLMIIPFEIAFLATGPLSGRLSDKYGRRLFTVLGLVITSIALVLLYTTDEYTSDILLLIYTIVLGIGNGLFVSPNISYTMRDVPPMRRSVASAFRGLFFNVGFLISLSIALLILTFYVPYGILTIIISTGDVSYLPQKYINLFVYGIKQTYLLLAIINAIGLPFSLFKEETATTKKSIKAEQILHDF
jgi:EmrB/QacA subfamily drug resistance transporter